MPSILIIDRNSTIKSTNVKTFSDDELYKKAGFKNKDGFAKHAQWTISVKNEPHTIDLYGKTAGRAGQENKYEFPPPADNTLFFGSCIIVCRKNDEVIDISPKEWEKVYEFLYGGFEDIAKGDSDTDDDDSDEDDNVPRTKQGYVKDGFIVDDDDAEDDDYSQSSESANERVSAKTKKPAAAKSPKTPKKTNAKSSAKTPKKSKSADSTAAASVQPENIQFVLSDEPNEPVYLSCTDELVEETYI